MPEFERRKGMHLTLEDRQEIQKGLRLSDARRILFQKK